MKKPNRRFGIGIDDIDPVAEYKISDLDGSGETEYYGFIDMYGNWYIMKLTATEARYVKGASDYETNWTGRAGLEYSYFHELSW